MHCNVLLLPRANRINLTVGGAIPSSFSPYSLSLLISLPAAHENGLAHEQSASNLFLSFAPLHILLQIPTIASTKGIQFSINYN